MGLDTTHDCWHGAYSAFSRWREKLAEVAGYQVWSVAAEHGGTRPLIMLDWGGIHATIGQDLFGKWPNIPTRADGTPDPLIILFAHSDCEGELQPEFLTPLADRLAEVIPLLPDGDGGGHVRNWRATTQKFIDGLRLASSRGEAVGFH